MEVVKIDQLPQAAALNDNDRLIINQADTSRANLSKVKEYMQGDLPQRITNAINEVKGYTDQLLSGRNEWLPPVNTVSQLKTTGLDKKINYLCKVIADPVKSGVYQAVAGWTSSPQWTLFNDTVDLVNEQELAASVNNEAQTRLSADQNLQNNINAEASTRETEDQNLLNNINAEKLAREQAVQAEAQARAQGDIDTLIAAKNYANELAVEIRIPAGGLTGQVLAKATNADFDTEWITKTGGGGGMNLMWGINEPAMSGDNINWEVL